ncbi:MAG: hypothetical protein FRX49_13339 [Trebouxia sp. A1-2]|nr:MAG: hypothetical protein FRX49_13339 [Trebouxia sp. A1-2]
MIQPLPTSDALGFKAWALGFATKTTLSLEDLLPNVATADVRDLGSKQVQEHKVGEAPQVAHAHESKFRSRRVGRIRLVL